MSKKAKFLNFDLFKSKLQQIDKDDLHILLCGGESIKLILKSFFESSRKASFILNIYLSDERLVQLDSSDSNFFQISALMEEIGFDSYKINQFNESFFESVEDNFFDFCFLSLAKDGHYAGLVDMKISDEMIIQNLKINNDDFSRKTLNFPFFNKMNNTYLIIKGSDRLQNYEKLKNQNDNIVKRLEVKNLLYIE